MEYRCYFLNRHSHIERAAIVEAATDAEAVGRAEALFAEKGAEFSAIEVWDRARRLHHRQRVRQVPGVQRELGESPERIRRWRMKAEEIRTAADGFGHGPARQAFLNSAATYDALADAAEARFQRQKDRKPEAG